jgi:hypothetical protein
MAEITQLYRMIADQLEARRVALGLNKAQCERMAGQHDRYWSHMVHHHQKYARQHHWRKVEAFIDVLYPDGWRIELAARGRPASAALGTAIVAKHDPHAPQVSPSRRAEANRRWKEDREQRKIERQCGAAL